MPVANYAELELRAILAGHPDMLEVWEVAALTNSHERTVRRWLEKGRLKGLQKGARAFLIPKQALVDYLCGGGRSPTDS